MPCEASYQKNTSQGLRVFLALPSSMKSRYIGQKVGHSLDQFSLGLGQFVAVIHTFAPTEAGETSIGPTDSSIANESDVELIYRFKMLS